MARGLVLALAIALSPAASAAAADPSALSKVSSGLWEISGAPGAKGPLRQCVADIAALAQFEHRGHACTHKVIQDGAESTVIEYSCGAAGFGRSRLDVVTPRALTISTQGISDQLPFSYVLLARRVGDCSKGTAVMRH